jgi:hypothetical protein
MTSAPLVQQQSNNPEKEVPIARQETTGMSNPHQPPLTSSDATTPATFVVHSCQQPSRRTPAHATGPTLVQTIIVQVKESA